MRNAYYEYDNFAITEFEADFPRCKHCGDIIIKQSETLKNTCSKCDNKVYSLIIRRCGIPAVEDILSNIDMEPELSMEEIVNNVLKNDKVCHSLIERYNKLLKEKKLKL